MRNKKKKAEKNTDMLTITSSYPLRLVKHTCSCIKKKNVRDRFKNIQQIDKKYVQIVLKNKYEWSAFWKTKIFDYLLVSKCMFIWI